MAPLLNGFVELLFCSGGECTDEIVDWDKNRKSIGKREEMHVLGVPLAAASPL